MTEKKFTNCINFEYIVPKYSYKIILKNSLRWDILWIVLKKMWLYFLILK